MPEIDGAEWRGVEVDGGSGGKQRLVEGVKGGEGSVEDGGDGEGRERGWRGVEVGSGRDGDKTQHDWQLNWCTNKQGAESK